MTSTLDAQPIDTLASADRLRDGTRDASALPRRRTRILLASPSWLGGGLLFACLFLPLMKGCDGDIFPYEALGDKTTAATFLDGLWWIAPYVFGALTGLGSLLAAIVGDWRLYRWWWRGYVVVASILAVAYWAAIGAEARAAEADPVAAIASRWIAVSMSIVAPLLLWLSYRNGRTWVVKTAFLQFAFACACLAWFLYLGVLLWGEKEWGLRYGGMLSIVACWLLLAGAIVQWKLRRLLSQSGKPRQRRQSLQPHRD